MAMFAAAVPFFPLARLNLHAAIEILLLAVVIYYLFKPLRAGRAVQIVVAAVLLFVLYQAARWAQLEMIEWLPATLLPYIAIALVVLFQPEIRRGLARLSNTFNLARFSSSNPSSAFDDIVLAAAYFSQNRIGALIAFERDVTLRTYIESGIPLDANLSYDLLLAIFRPGAPLHDGAVIVQKSRIAAASCFLPLSLNPMISNQLGTRHRAAIGITEESDAVAVLVSEQTGAISLAFGGAIELGLTAEQLADRLTGITRKFRRTIIFPSNPSGARVSGKME
jgi:diadenylate cyclase